MARSFDNVVNIENVLAGRRATVRLPLGPTYDKIHFKLTNVTAAQLTNFKLELSGILVSDFASAALMQSIDQYLGRTIESGYFTWHFNEDDVLAELSDGRFFGLATRGLSSATISFDIAAGVTDPNIEIFVERSEPFPAVGQWIRKLRSYPIQQAAAAFTETTTLPLTRNPQIPGPGGVMIDQPVYAARYYVQKSDIGDVEFKVDSVTFFKLPKAVNEYMQRRYKRVPQAGFNVLDFTLQGDMKQAFPLLPTIQDYRIKHFAATGGQTVIHVDYYDRFGNPL
ncbi:major capsid protein P2 [Arsukibacterium sp.]|uniref:major capsid protein P2 n=1 Tax=Arsukibacterium sp. TaxID=1977258 RepID=UPI002FDB4F4C